MSEMSSDPRVAQSSAPLTPRERRLMERLFSEPSELPLPFKNWVSDYVSNNGTFHIQNIPTLKGEDWRYVGAAGQPAFTNNAANFDGGTPPYRRSVRFFKDHANVVRLQGLIGFTGAYTANTTMFTLPEGYRPYTDGTIGGVGVPDQLLFPIAYWTGGGGAGFVAGGTNAVIQIGTDGTVFSPAVGFTTGWGVWLDGINFRAAA